MPGEEVHSPASPDDAHPDESRPRKRQRVRLSCLECRRRKLSCDRGFPCQRCTKSGTPERCQYEGQDGSVLDAAAAAAGASPVLARLGARQPTDSADVVIREAPRDLDRIRRMEYEIAALKTQLARQTAMNMDSSTIAAASTPGTQKGDAAAASGETPDRTETDKHISGHEKAIDMNHPDGLLDKELRFFRGKEFRTRYFGPANATMAFSELNGLCPFMKETAEEWLKPARLQERKDKRKRQDYQDIKFAMADPSLEALLPSREDTNALVTCYLDQFEQLHRIVHIPSFLRDYDKFWNSSTPRPAAMTALVLSMLAVSSSLYEKTPMRFIGTISTARYSAGRWIEAVERWHSAQSYKHRRLIHYQIMCMLYLGKRVNTIKKKKFWTGSGSLIQDGIAVGLHREPTAMNNRISPFNQEMRRRIWATIQEFDMQASFDYGLPTLLSQVHFDVAAPANLDDDQFDEDSAQLPASRPVKEYTYSSYQHLARQSLPLRLELSRILSGPPGETEYDMVQRYTNDLMQEIDALPSWEAVAVGEAAKKPLLAYTLLHIQLRQYILPLHQPYLKLRKANTKYQFSEIIYYNAARDMVLLHEKLYEKGVRTLNFLREDALTMAINLCSVTMLQPRGSTNMIMINSQNTVTLLKQCIEMKRDRLLRCGNNEPWGFCIMCSALGLLQTHLGMKTAEQAKQCASEHFMNLHYKIQANQTPEPVIPVDLQNIPYPLDMDVSANPDAAATAAAAAAAIMAQSWPLPVSGATAPLSGASVAAAHEVSFCSLCSLCPRARARACACAYTHVHSRCAVVLSPAPFGFCGRAVSRVRHSALCYLGHADPAGICCAGALVDAVAARPAVFAIAGTYVRYIVSSGVERVSANSAVPQHS
ncbi:hypothetical protein TD95_001950 [Thielaviopsis punctulata]|uniref:Zn(2)-C6 fungal-type domain-containing protein n=1 Tax=Thielaviopsis punctulata TaxID=72032 RepID=A0A0F4ZHL0_9PEZI|nr:hypothetical protein TD95_001950 [Thielaviopsis punctulata]